MAMMQTAAMLHLPVLLFPRRLTSFENFWPHTIKIELKPTEMKHVARIQETRVLKTFLNYDPWGKNECWKLNIIQTELEDFNPDQTPSTVVHQQMKSIV
jgi:hypothetical protein